MLRSWFTFCRRIAVHALVLLGGLNLARADFLDDANRILSLGDGNGPFHLRLSGLLDLEGYYLDQPAPCLIDTNDNFLFNPRLTIFVDARWSNYLYFFSQVRLDRGFDPSDEGAQMRLDEYFLRYKPFGNARLNFQIGKFATIVGNWVPRHYSWDNPFITAPLPYENLTGMWDIAAPDEVDTLLYWGHVPGYDTMDYSDKYLRLPIIWGPSYASGAAVSGAIEKFDYAVEMKNSSLASHPESWNVTQIGFDHPTFSGRLGFRPNEMWNFGLSVSSGCYLLPQAASSLPPGHNIGDFREKVVAQDISFAWHHLQLWAEVYETRFEVPRIGNVDTLAYYLEGKYKITPQLFVALRWNQQLFDTIPDKNKQIQWGNDVWRIDAALGYRFTNYLQGKLQYSFTHVRGDVSIGQQLLAAQLTLKF
jgi:hypothetical protein